MVGYTAVEVIFARNPEKKEASSDDETEESTDKIGEKNEAFDTDF